MIIMISLNPKRSYDAPELENRQIHFSLCSRSGFTSQLVENSKQRLDLMLLNLSHIVE